MLLNALWTFWLSLSRWENPQEGAVLVKFKLEGKVEFLLPWKKEFCHYRHECNAIYVHKGACSCGFLEFTPIFVFCFWPLKLIYCSNITLGFGFHYKKKTLKDRDALLPLVLSYLLFWIKETSWDFFNTPPVLTFHRYMKLRERDMYSMYEAYPAWAVFVLLLLLFSYLI